jgi:hypothetical protein
VVLEIITSILIVVVTLFTVLQKGKYSTDSMIAYIVFLLLLTLFCVGAHKAILLAMSSSPFIYILYGTKLNSAKISNAKSSTLEKVVLYLAIAPFFGLLFLQTDFTLIQSSSFSLKRLSYIPEIFLIFVTFVTFLEFVKFKGADSGL